MINNGNFFKELPIKDYSVIQVGNNGTVDEIRKKYATGAYTYAKLGEIYNLSYSMIGYIVRFDSWNVE